MGLIPLYNAKIPSFFTIFAIISIIPLDCYVVLVFTDSKVLIKSKGYTNNVAVAPAIAPDNKYYYILERFYKAELFLIYYLY